MHNIDFRLMLAALHFNENVNKEQAVTADGTPRWKVSYPKYKKGKEVLTKVTTKVTYGKFIFHLAFRQNSLNTVAMPLGIQVLPSWSGTFLCAELVLKIFIQSFFLQLIQEEQF